MNGSPNEGKSLALYQFEGKGLRVVEYRGQRTIIGRDLGRALEYSGDGKRLVNKVTQDWGAEMVIGTHYFMADGEDLAGLKVELEPDAGPSSIGKRARSVCLLTEEGVHLCLLKTEKPVGVRLRQFLAAEVMPRLMRGEGIPARQQQPPAEKVMSSSDRALLREARLYAKQLQAGGTDPKAASAWLAGVFHGVTGISTTKLLPVLDLEQQGKLPSEIAADLQREIGPAATEAKVGIVISRLGLRGKAGYSWQVMGKARGHDKSVQPFMYNAAAQALIIPEVKTWVEREAAELQLREARRMERKQKAQDRQQAKAVRLRARKKKTAISTPEDGDLFGSQTPA